MLPLPRHQFRPSSAFVSELRFPVRHPRREPLSPLRRPRTRLTSLSSNPPLKAVFLPPEGQPIDDPLLPPPNPNKDRPPPRLSSVDRLLEKSSPEYSTWVDYNSRRTLTSIREGTTSLLGADELNESLRPTYLQRHRHILAPDEAFAAIFSWDVVVSNSRELERMCWAAVAEEACLPPPDLDDIVRAEEMAPEAAISRVFFWTSDWGEIKRYVFRKHEVYRQLQTQFQYEKTSGIDEWLRALERYGVKCVLCASRPRNMVAPIVQSLGLDTFFSKNEIVSADDEFETLEQMFLVAALKCEHPPGKCVVFTDKPSGITAGHEVSSKVVAIIGAHPAYEMKTADQIVSDYDDLVVYNIRRLFSEAGVEHMDRETQLEREVTA